MFDATIFESVQRIKPSARGELEITDAIQDLIDRGLDVHPHIVRGWWKDTGKLDDMLEANRIVLEGLDARRGAMLGAIGEGSRIEGRVEIGEGVELIDSLVRGPVVIGDGTRLENAFVGPYTSIGSRCTLVCCEIENSIILVGQRDPRHPAAHRRLADRPQRADRQDRLQAQGLPLHARRQLRGGDHLALRVLVFGGTGMLGRAVVAEARSRGCPALGAVARAGGHRATAGACSTGSTPSGPSVVVNCAAFTQGGRLRGRGAGARLRDQRRGGGPRRPRRRERAGARLVHVSTDYVFDGLGRRNREPYREDAPVAPLSVYGQSKLEGERRALAYDRGAGGAHELAVRPRRPQLRGHHGAADRGGQAAAPGGARPGGAARPTRRSWRRRSSTWRRSEATGVMHYRNREPVSWYAFASEIARLWCGTRITSERTTEVVPVTTADFPRPAPRPAYSVLDVSRFEEAAGRRVEPWSWGLVEYLACAAEKRERQSMRALITGITGFAGSHLAEYLLAEHPDVEVYGTYRWRSRMDNIEHLRSKVKLLEADLRDYTSMHSAPSSAPRPDYIFHLAAQSFVPSSWTAPNETLTTNVVGPDQPVRGGARPASSTRSSRSPAPASSTAWCCRTRRRSRRPTRCGRSRRTRSPRWRRTTSATSTSRATA